MNNHCVGADHCMVAHDNGTEQLGTGTNVNMTSNNGCATRCNGSKGHLLKNQAIGTHSGIRMEHDSIWMGQKKPPLDTTIQRNIGTTDNAPKPVSDHCPVSQRETPPPRDAPALVVPDAGQQPFAGVPLEKTQLLSLPVGFRRADFVC